MARHEWTDPQDNLSYAVSDHDRPTGDVRDVLRREILRLAEERDNWKRSAEWDSEQRDLANAASEERERKLREALLTAIPQAVADRLLTNGGGEVGARLVIEGPAQEDFGGWCRSAVEDATRGVLRALLKEE